MEQRNELKAANIRQLRALGSEDLIKISSWLYHNDYKNPVRLKIWSLVPHSYFPTNRVDWHKFTNEEATRIFEVAETMRKEAEARTELLKKLKRRKRR